MFKDGCCSAEIRIRIATAIARIIRIWKSNTISYVTRFRLYRSLVVSILLYGCITSTMLADMENKIQAYVRDQINV